MRRAVTVEAPCTCGNFGPGFDVFSLALARRGDRVTLAEADADEVRVTGVGADRLPRDFATNAAAVAVDHLRRALGLETRHRLDLDKGAPPGSGLGSSASSAAAGALAFRHLHRDLDVPRDVLLEAAVAGERAAAGDHRDDVSAALFGGLAVVPPRPAMPFRLEPPRALRLAYALPAVALETKRMRAVLPPAWPRADVVFNLSQVARMVDAVHRGDVAAIGRAVEDRLAAPYRAPFVPAFEDARHAAREAGAFGFALSGSGPAVFAVADSDARARDAMRAMLDALGAAGVKAEGFVTGPSYRGVDDAEVPLS